MTSTNLESDTDSLYLALCDKELYDCIREESKIEGEVLRTKDCKDDFTANATTNFFPRTCGAKDEKLDKRELGLFKEEIRCTKCCVYAVKTIDVRTPIPANTFSAAKI